MLFDLPTSNECTVDKVNSGLDADWKNFLDTNVGLSSSDIAGLPPINPFNKDDMPTVKVEAFINIAEKKSKTAIDTGVIVSANKQSDANGTEEAETSEVQGALVEVTKWAEPTFSANKTSPTDLDDAHYSATEDYPNTYGFIDKVKNWLKVNQEQKKVEIVHSSGSAFKIDSEGNATLDIKGGLKFMVGKDLSINVGGSRDLLIGKDSYTSVSLSRTLEVGTTDDSQAGLVMTRKALLIQDN